MARSTAVEARPRNSFSWKQALGVACANAVLAAGVLYWKWNLLELLLATLGELIVVAVLHAFRLRASMIGLVFPAGMLALVAWAFVQAGGLEPLERAVVPAIMLVVVHAPAARGRSGDIGPLLRASAALAGVFGFLVAYKLGAGHAGMLLAFLGAKASVEVLGVALGPQT